ATGAIIGRGITAPGGRPHAEPIALAEAGERARGATAYVTLEPCAHHGRTPPCAETLIAAGIARVVAAATDPDDRVSGRGYAMLRAAGMEVISGVLADQAADCMADYLVRSAKKRPEVTLKIALSADGMIGRAGAGYVPLTGPEANGRVRLRRAASHAIMIGGGTARADNPMLTCRLPGLEKRSPIRIVIGRGDALAAGSRMIETLDVAPVWLAPSVTLSPERVAELTALGVRVLSVERYEGRVALPELLEDLTQQGVMSVLVEGGPGLTRSLLDEGLVDRIILLQSPDAIGAGGIASPLLPSNVGPEFCLAREEVLGRDQCLEWVRKDRF